MLLQCKVICSGQKVEGHVMAVISLERPFQSGAAQEKNEDEKVTVRVRGRATCCG